MHLYALPMICVLAGVALYAVLGGADFGAGLWQLATILAPHRGEARRARAERIREHAHHSMGPVWEANHVWLIFVLTVTWTAYPAAFGAIASTLAAPLLLAGVGVVFRGAAYALRSGTAEASELGLIDTVFSLSSILTPFALGTVVGAIASGRVPLGNAAGPLLSSWLHPTSIAVGVLAVAVCAYMGAVYLAADAARGDERELVDAFRARALAAGVLAGAVAIAALPIVHADAHRLYHRLLDGPGLAGFAVSVLGGASTLALVAARRFELARASAALAVAGVIAGWALAQQPLLLARLTLAQAAAPHDVLIALLVAIAAGGAILFPSLALLFGLLLRGRFDPGGARAQQGERARCSGEGAALAQAAGSQAADAQADGRQAADAQTDGRQAAGAQAADAQAGAGAGRLLAASSSGLCARLSLAGLIGGLGLLSAAEAPWAHGLGVACLFACMVFAFAAVDPTELARREDAE
ncbi:MAG TPA: cytochrome d ubiquinol oxidase subunit II [Solirubrobacteraceae bacterium]|nr:cytochrome d ubiquinol oxidase subunit II [Solirubrobacteraceae bacterium]